ncbi:ExeM/NucH family extracellular endonuclease [Thalassomonas haliotis]|uniref:ExeM/NucH family extracellular endonuclease n=1 Tax=Thalassomonas haliotis TaxID=485448 RepID=A0ABY7VGF3_9GAMM|nr:ExeM/NucH family extracellular endonuclease [Thalassomonas haliotis]WDE12555.1 ExeM/NucH family extracellular endonuclease [Thalassomonas haliotis]
MKLKIPALLAFFCVPVTQASELVLNAVTGNQLSTGTGITSETSASLEGVCYNCPDLAKIADASTFDDAVYYADAINAVNNNDSAAEIKAAINTIISTGHKILTYSEVWTALTETDEDPANPDNVILLYKGTSLAKLSNGSGSQSSNPDNWNREHVWAKSHGFSSSSNEAYTDIHHLRPTDISVNSSRGNLDFDNSMQTLSESPNTRIDSNSFEPRDEVKGDVARMVLYMDIRYEGLDTHTPDLTVVDRLTSTSEPALGRLCRLLEWHVADPVDATEQNRNDRIFEYQGNRNPFIDHSEWVDLLYSADTCVDDTTGGDGGGTDGGGTDGGGDGGGTGGGTDGGTGNISSNGQLTITEVMQNPGNGLNDSDAEWFEILNTGTGDINLNGWTIKDEGSDSFTITQDVIIPMGSYAVLGKSTDTVLNGGINVVYAYGDGMALSNGSDEILLVSPEGEVVDTIAYDNGNEWPDPNGASMTLISATTDNSLGGNWTTESEQNYAEGNFGTPGTGEATFELVITEVMQNPSAVADSAGEWFEVLNKGAIAVNINGWTLRDDDNDSHQITEDVILPAGAYSVFANNSDSSTNGGVEAIYQFSGMYLSNGSDELVLEMSDGTIADNIAWDGGPQWPDPTGKSMTLTSASLDNNVGSNWFEETSKSFGDGNFGTPGTGPDVSDGTDASTIGICADEASLISSIQGIEDITSTQGQKHVIEGVVTGVFANLNGFFVQEEHSDEDGDPQTSEGLFVANNANTVTPAVGAVVRVFGEVSESYGRTQLNASEDLLDCGTGSVSATSLSLPFASAQAPEALEGMLITIDSPLTVSNNYDLGKYGEVTLSNGRIFTPTNIYRPGTAEAIALAASNALNQVTLDDGQNGTNPETVIYPSGNLSASNTLRAGDQVTALTGVMDYSYSKYRIIPSQAPDIAAVNTRTDAPQLTPGNLTVASMNVLNLFNGDGQGGGFPTSRGADNLAEYERQVAKTVAAIIAMNADIIGLMEIENDGVDANSTLVDLVSRLNAVAGDNSYAFVNTGGPLGTDAIAVALLYKPGTVSPAADARVNNDEIFNRPPLAQTFSLNENGEQITIIANHFKAKLCTSATDLDKDQDDGQSCYNAKRQLQAQALIDWIASDSELSTQKDVLVMGDLNAYAMEDPIVKFTDQGYTNLIKHFNGTYAYSYSYGGAAGYLDHALANDSLLAKTVDTTDWHINADEPLVLDYNTENKSEQQLADFYAEDAYRVADHDPVVISFQLEKAVQSGDVNGDGTLDFTDYMLIYGMLGSTQGSANFDQAADLDADGQITFADMRLWQQIYANP